MKLFFFKKRFEKKKKNQTYFIHVSYFREPTLFLHRRKLTSRQVESSPGFYNITGISALEFLIKNVKPKCADSQKGHEQFYRKGTELGDIRVLLHSLCSLISTLCWRLPSLLMGTDIVQSAVPWTHPQCSRTTKPQNPKRNKVKMNFRMIPDPFKTGLVS